MAQLQTKFIKDNAVTDAKVRLSNAGWLRSRNAANSADVNIVQVDGSNRIQFATVPQSSQGPSANNDMSNKFYVDNAVANLSDKNKTEFFSLTSTNISNGYVDLANPAFHDSVDVFAGGVGQVVGTDYSLSDPGGVTRVTFLTPLTNILVAGDEIAVNYTVATSIGSQQPSGKYTFSALSNLTRVTAVPANPGEYRCFQKNASASTGSDHAPTTAPTVADGFAIGAFNFATAGSGSYNISRWDFFIGKNKSYQIMGYTGAARAGHLVTDFFEEGSAFASGFEAAYNDYSGVLSVSVIRGSSANTTNAVGESVDPNGGSATDVSTGYFDVIVSDNPTGVGTIGNYTGQIIPMGTNIVPFGTLECDGSEVSRTIYSRLFSIIGANFGAGTPIQSSANLTVVADVATPATATAFGGTFTAQTDGLIGNSISLVFDGSTDITTVVSNWNGSNPNNQVAFSGSNSTPTAQTVNLGGATDNLDGLYFDIYDDTGLVVPWIQIASTTTQPSVGGATRYIAITTILPNDNNTTVASKIAAALAADGQFTPTTAIGAVVNIVNSSTNAHAAGDAGNTPFSYSQITPGGNLTFNLPDLRGYFIRGWDHGAGHDPDSSTRTALNTGGNTGDAVGSYQADQNQSHTHAQAPHSHTYVIVNSSKGGGSGSNGSNGTTTSTGATTAGNYNSGGNQSNPRNVGVMYVIVY